MAIQAQLYPNSVGFPLWGSQDWIIDHGCGTAGLFTHSCLDPQQKHMQQQQQQQRLEQRMQQLCNEMHRNQDMFHDTNLLVSGSKPNNINDHPSILNSGSLDLEFEMQSQEMDHYIKLQSEKLRITLQEQRKQQVATLLKRMELNTLYLLRQKDQEIAQAAKKRAELEEFLNRLEAENQAWRRVAQENEAMVLSLHNTIEEMKEKAFYSFNNGVVADDAQSCCDESGGNYREMEEEKDTGENRVEGGGGGVEEDDEQITRKMMTCKSCNSGRSCFLFLPCRHLCSCKACEAFLEACPVCRMPKKACIETLIF